MDTKNKSERRTLIASQERLDSRANAIDELARMSDRLLYKFQRTEDSPVCMDGMVKNAIEPKTPDLIELFDILAERMEKSINIIGANLEKAMSFID